MHGVAGLKEKKLQRYSNDFKLSVLKRMRQEQLSYRQAAALFDIHKFDIIGLWERRFDEGGFDALTKQPNRAGRPKTFYYQQKALQAADKYAELKDKIRSTFDEHKGRYGYRRITAAVRSAGHLVNHKTVQRLMVQLQLKSLVRVKKYRAYKGEVGKAAPNLLKREFEAPSPNKSG